MECTATLFTKGETAYPCFVITDDTVCTEATEVHAGVLGTIGKDCAVECGVANVRACCLAVRLNGEKLNELGAGDLELCCITVRLTAIEVDYDGDGESDVVLLDNATGTTPSTDTDGRVCLVCT